MATVAIDLIAKHIQRMLNERGFRVRNALASVAPSVKLPPTVQVMRATPQRTVSRAAPSDTAGKRTADTRYIAPCTCAAPRQVLHTMIRDRSVSRDDFIFYSQRLVRMLVEEGLSLLPFEEHDVVTPSNAVYKGVRQLGDVRAEDATGGVVTEKLNTGAFVRSSSCSL